MRAGGVGGQPWRLPTWRGATRRSASRGSPARPRLMARASYS